MKICHVMYDDVANPWLGGGGAIRAREIYRRLADRHEITLITGRFPGGRTCEDVDGLHLVRVGTDRGYALSRLGFCARAMSRLRAEEWDVWVHEFSAFAPLWVPRPLRRRGVLSFYHFVGSHALRKHPIVGGVAWAAEAAALRRYRRILTISPSVTERVRRTLGGKSVRIDCVFTGVDSAYFELQPEELPYVMYFGRTDVHTKGMDVLVAALARIAPAYPEVTLRIAGRGAPRERQLLDRLIRDAGLEARTEVVGVVDEARKGDLLRQALFICMPSRYEGWGIAAVEAAAAGKPVLGTRVAGLTDAVQDGETGILVEPESPEALAAGMRRLLDDGALRSRLGRAGRVWARRFDWDEIARVQEGVLQRAADENALVV